MPRLQRVAEAGNVRQALEVLKRSPELAMEFSVKAFVTVMARASKEGNLGAVFKCAPSSFASFM